MRKLIAIIILGVLAGSGYAAYNVMTYAPSQPNVTQFNIDTSRYEDDELKKQLESQIDLPPDLEKEKQRIMANMRKAFEQYETYAQEIPQQARASMQMLVAMMKRGRLPAYFVTPGPPGMPLSLEKLQFQPDNTRIIESQSQNPVICTDYTFIEDIRTKIEETDDDREKQQLEDLLIPQPERFDMLDIIIGTPGDNVIECAPEDISETGDQFFLGGPGNDTITDMAGNKIINPGSGDDTVKAGRGRTIIIYESGWGQDTLETDCAQAEIDKASLPEDPVMPWTYQYTNFIIFGPLVEKDEVDIDGNVIENTRTGDKITLTGDCYNYLFAMEGTL